MGRVAQIGLQSNKKTSCSLTFVRIIAQKFVGSKSKEFSLIFFHGKNEFQECLIFRLSAEKFVYF